VNGDILSSRKKVSFLRLTGTLLALGLLAYLLYRQGWGEIRAAVQQISVWRFLAAFGLTLISRLFVSGRWYVLLKSAGVDITTGQSVRLTFAGLFASNFLPTTVGGDMVRLGGGMRMQYDRPTLIASLVVDRLVGMAGMAMALPFGIPALMKSSLVGGPAFVLQAAFMARLGENAFWIAAREKLLRVMRRLLAALTIWFARPKALLASLACSWGHMLCLFLSLWILLAGMDSAVSLWLIAGLWSLSYFVTLLPVSINGLGVQELSLTLLFSMVGGVLEPNALTLAFLIRILQMFASLPGSLFIPEMLVGKEVPIS
jgi:glycosyltransferase 2 family protein